MALRGHLHHSAKLNDDSVADIVWRYQQGGNTYQSLADEYGVEVYTINSILRGRTWKHVTGGVPTKAPARPQDTHCSKGHEWTPENTILRERADRPNPQRRCRTCHNKTQNEYWKWRRATGSGPKRRAVPKAG